MVLPLQVRGALLALQIRRPTEEELDTCDVYEITSPLPWHPEQMNEDEVTPAVYDEMQRDYDDIRHINLSKSKHTKPKPGDIEEYFYYPPQDTCQKTIEANTQYGTMVNSP